MPLGLLGVLLSTANLLTLPVPAWAGTLADRYGALQLVIAAQLLQGLGFLAYGGVHGVVGVLVSSTAVSVGVRVFWSCVFTAVADHADASGSRTSRDGWYARSSVARTAGLAAGGLVTGLVVADGSPGAYRAVAVVASACFLAAALLLAVLVRTPHRVARADAPGYGGVLRDRPFLALTGLNAVFALASMMLPLALPTVVLTGLRAPSWLVPGALVANAVLVSLLATRLVARVAAVRRIRTLAVSAGCWGVGSLLLALLAPGHLAATVGLLAVAVVLYTVAEALHAPVSQALAERTAPEDARGRYLATFQYSWVLAAVVGPTLFTTAYGLGRAVPWLALAGLTGLALAGVLRLERVLPEAALRTGPPTGRGWSGRRPPP